MFTIDAHLDLATNAIALNRDLTKPVLEIRAKEGSWVGKTHRIVATERLHCLNCERKCGPGGCNNYFKVFGCRQSLPTNNLPGWHSPEQAYAYGQAQLAWYRIMEDMGEMVQVCDLPALEKALGSLAG